MKKLLSICSILTIFTFSCGFVKTDTIINIDKNKNISIEKSALMSDEYGEEFLNSFTNTENIKRDGLKIETKKENGYTGIVGKKEYKLDDVSNTNLDKLDIDKFLNKDFNDKSLIKVEKGFFKNKYTIEYNYTRDALSDLETLFIANNPYKISDTDEVFDETKYTNCVSMIENASKVDDKNKNKNKKNTTNTNDITNCQTYVDGYDNYKKELDAKIEKLSREISYKLIINLPVKVGSSNASSTSDDHKELTWNFKDEGSTLVICSFEILNMNNIYMLGGGTLLLIAIVIVLIMFINKKKKGKVVDTLEDKPIHTDYDPSIESELDAMGGFIDRGNETPIPEPEMVTNNNVINEMKLQSSSDDVTKSVDTSNKTDVQDKVDVPSRNDILRNSQISDGDNTSNIINNNIDKMTTANKTTNSVVDNNVSKISTSSKIDNVNRISNTERINNVIDRISTLNGNNISNKATNSSNSVSNKTNISDNTTKETNNLHDQNSVATGSYEYTLPYEVPHVVKEKEPEKEPMFITSQNTKPDEIIIEDKPKEIKIITPEITEIK